jgi:glutathione S-transferase
LPYLIDQDVRLTDPAAIMTYLCHKYAPELLGTTPKEKAEIDMVL